MTTAGSPVCRQDLHGMLPPEEWPIPPPDGIDSYPLYSVSSNQLHFNFTV